MSSYKIIIPGEPGSLIMDGENRFWSSSKQRRCNAKIETERQFPHDKLTSPLALYVTFFFRPKRQLTLEPLIGKQNVSNPNIHALLRYVSDILSGIVYFNDNIIYSISADKYYSINSRTEVKIIEREVYHVDRDKEIQEYKERKKSNKVLAEKAYF